MSLLSVFASKIAVAVTGLLVAVHIISAPVPAASHKPSAPEAAPQAAVQTHAEAERTAKPAAESAKPADHAYAYSAWAPQQTQTQAQEPPVPAYAPAPVPAAPAAHQETQSDTPPLLLKSIGVNFSDFVFTRDKLQFGRMFMEYGYVIPASMTSTGQSKPNPQAVFIVPAGTPVRSLVDGVVVNVAKVWSGDYTIQVTQSGKQEQWMYETEHVINPKVAVGDKVLAGQIIAEVSTFDSNVPQGYGAVEIGILKGGNPPEHVCPFAYFDDSVKDSMLAQIKDLFTRWEAYAGDSGLYNENESIPGCATLGEVAG